MSKEIGRRKFIRYAGAGIAVAATAVAGYGAYSYFAPRPKEPLVVAQWGGPYIEAQKPIAEEFTKQTGIPILDELHAGSSAGIVGKIRADLPDMKRHVVANWDPAFISMDNEGWLAPLTPDKVPVSAEYPDSVKVIGPRSKQVIAIPFGVAASAWAYREDLFPKDLQPFDDYNKLLDPRLKGKVMMPTMTAGAMSCWLFAVAMGGDEKNMEPGWEFTKELAEAGQIGIVYGSDVEAITNMTTGDAWISCYPLTGVISQYRKGVPMKVDKGEVVKQGVYFEGFVVTESPRKEDAYKFYDFFYKLDNHEKFAAACGNAPAHPKAKVEPFFWDFYATPEELDKYAYRPDYAYIDAHMDEWQMRFEEEILPLIKQ